MFLGVGTWQAKAFEAVALLDQGVELAVDAEKFFSGYACVNQGRFLLLEGLDLSRETRGGHG